MKTGSARTAGAQSADKNNAMETIRLVINIYPSAVWFEIEKILTIWINVIFISINSHPNRKKHLEWQKNKVDKWM